MESVLKLSNTVARRNAKKRRKEETAEEREENNVADIFIPESSPIFMAGMRLDQVPPGIGATGKSSD